MTERRTITVLLGDGIGPEVMNATMRVLDSLRAGLAFEVFPYGEATGGTLPQDALESFKRNKFGLKGPTATPPAGGYMSPAFHLRKTLELYANVRPVSTLPNVTSKYNGGSFQFAIVREISEGEYKLSEEVQDGGDRVLTTFETTREACRKVAEFAF